MTIGAVDTAFESGEREDAVRSVPTVAPVRRPRRLRYFRSRAWGWTLVVAVLVLWQLSSIVALNATLSSPVLIAQTWWTEVTQGDLLKELAATLRTMAIGFVIAVPGGIVIGFLMGRVKVIWATLEPFVEILRLTPATAIIPIFILFLGLGDQMQIAVFLLSASFPLILNSYAGARSVSRTLRETAQTYHLNWLQTQLEIALPASIPFVLVGIRQALGISLVMAVVVGMLSGSNGIGYYILMAQQALNTRQLLAAVFTVAAVGYLLNAIFLLIERRATRWRRTDSSD